MLAGNGKDRIDIYNEVEEKDEYSARKKTYKFAFTDRADISFMSASEKMIGQMQIEDKILRFKVRYCVGRYTERAYILFNGDYYNIRSIDNDRRRTYILIEGQRVPAGTINITTDE